ncbi:hypothetical protein AWO35_004061 [Escherichia coli]|nr:hypothetical protein [Escherichia coli]HAX0301796.1 hypothetical protein [Escherichia coli CD471]EFJ8858613.1 hypothetical protein [Escherichia coli]EFJ9349542.1 hypothetical protein [Escherichia coli]EFJ9401017.1 hypothetical protein [Escherichia coli]
MKKTILLFGTYLFMSQNACSADYIVMLWTHKSGYIVNQSIDVPWSGKKILLSPPPPKGDAIKFAVTCSVPKIMGAWYSTTSWIAVPERIEIAGESVPIEVDAISSWHKHFSAGGYDYWYHVDWRNYKFDENLSSDCGQPEDSSSSSINVYYDGLTLKFDVPRGLPTGQTNASLVMGGGKEEQYWSAPGKTMYLPDSFIRSGIKNIRYNFTFNIRNSCTTGSLYYTIEHGDLTPSEAEKSDKKINIPVNCTGPTEVEFKLMPERVGSGEYGGKPSVGLGNGWDALIKLNGKSVWTDNISWDSAGTKNIEIKSSINNVNGVAGKLEGSLILIIQPK